MEMKRKENVQPEKKNDQGKDENDLMSEKILTESELDSIAGGVTPILIPPKT
ncbi:MAG: hypothetical protein WCD89_03580 [Anaerocolumna sp.]